MATPETSQAPDVDRKGRKITSILAHVDPVRSWFPWGIGPPAILVAGEEGRRVP